MGKLPFHQPKEICSNIRIMKKRLPSWSWWWQLRRWRSTSRSGSRRSVLLTTPCGIESPPASSPRGSTRKRPIPYRGEALQLNKDNQILATVCNWSMNNLLSVAIINSKLFPELKQFPTSSYSNYSSKIRRNNCISAFRVEYCRHYQQWTVQHFSMPY